MKQQQGFTLIELVVVIVILGILAATAIPKFVDLRADAIQAKVDAVAGALSSANSLNVAGCLIKNNATTTGVCAPMAGTDKCSTLGTLLAPTLTITSGNSTVEGAYFFNPDTSLTTAGVTCTLKLYTNGAATSSTVLVSGNATS